MHVDTGFPSFVSFSRKPLKVISKSVEIRIHHLIRRLITYEARIFLSVYNWIHLQDDRSIQTSIGEWFGKFLKKKDESQQTSLCEDVKDKKKNKTSTSSIASSSEFISTSESSENLKMKSVVPNLSASVSISTQYSPPPGYDRLSIEPIRARSSSTSGLGTSIFEEETRQEVIVQTDDSYLKIARRLDEYRNNKTQFLPVYAAAPSSSEKVEPFKWIQNELQKATGSFCRSDRPSERSHYYFGGRRSSLNRSRKKSRQDVSHRDSQNGTSMDAELLKEVLVRWITRFKNTFLLLSHSNPTLISQMFRMKRELRLEVSLEYRKHWITRDRFG